jgi:hypothetical protein
MTVLLMSLWPSRVSHARLGQRKASRMTQHLRIDWEPETSDPPGSLADHLKNIGRQLAAALGAEHLNAVSLRLQALQGARRQVGACGSVLAAFDPTDVERPIPRRVEIEIGPAQAIASLTRSPCRYIRVNDSRSRSLYRPWTSPTGFPATSMLSLSAPLPRRDSREALAPL